MPIRRIALGGVLIVVLAACGSSAPAGSTTPAVTVAPGAATAGAVTSPADSTPPSSAPASAPPPAASFAGDPALQAGFPTQVAGKPVTNVQISRLVDFFAAFQTPQDQIDSTRKSLAAIGINLDTVVIGLASATVNGSPVSIQAFTVPGLDGNTLVQNYALISPLGSGETLKQESVGGKTVSVVRDSNGYASTWLYAHGEIVWSIATSDVKEATAVFAALP
ncbi:MAG TPA: hypothetical protein VF323_03960 [Candidatus Limnocylindrales bacterium]